MSDVWLTDPDGIVEDNRFELAHAIREVLGSDTMEDAYDYVKQLREHGAAELPEGLSEAQRASLGGLGLLVLDSDEIADRAADQFEAEVAQQAAEIFSLAMIALSAAGGDAKEAVILLARLAELSIMPDQELMAAATIIGRTL